MPKPNISLEQKEEATASFTEKEVEQAIKDLPNGKGLGPDEISAEIIKELAEAPGVIGVITNALNMYAEQESKMMDSWRETITFLIHKGKGTTTIKS